MTGHGSANYFNENYLERLEEVKFYSKIHKPKKILIIGRWSYKKEDKVIKGLLINEGYNDAKKHKKELDEKLKWKNDIINLL